MIPSMSHGDVDGMMLTPWDAIGVWLWGHDDDDDDVDPMGCHRLMALGS